MFVIVTKNIKAFQVRNSKHIVYAHQNMKGEIYIGQSVCIVNRWAEHNQIANTSSHPEYDQVFKKSLRENKHWRHYVIAIANTQAEADFAESAAIAHYKPQLNSHPGRGNGSPSQFGFVPLNAVGREISIDAKVIKRYLNQERFTDSERKIIKCLAIRKPGKSHISFECIDDGCRVSISHHKRVGFKVGDRVSISFAAKTKGLYTTTKYSEVTLD